MPFETGTRLGPYEILSSIGDGSEDRYKASDTRRNQIVALKILPAEFAEHPDLKARLERDARTISSLNHPLIGAVIDVAHHEPSTDFIVSEFVEGETLAQRLARGPLELREALTIAIAMCETLDKAHRNGVIHAGLNPSLVLLTVSGPKLLDFAAPKFGQLAGTVESSLTATHTSLSMLAAAPTVAAPYLAPEQFAGNVVDARSDIFAFGAVLYEMVTGSRAFDEKTQTLLIAAIQTVDPEPASKVRPGIPPALDYVIARCLNKDPQQRLQTAFDAMNELQWIGRGASTAAAAAPTTATRKNERAVWIGVAVASLLAAAMVPSLIARFARAPEPPEVRFMASTLPAGTAPITVSPDGRWITSSVNAANMVGLSLNSVTPQPMVNGLPIQPFWSADSRSMAYFEDGKLKRVDIGGGPPQIICDTPAGFSSGAWNRDGVILFPAGGVIQRVLAAGGQPTPITALDQSQQETEHVGPAFLPDGRRFLFLAVSAQPDKSAVYVGSLDSTTRTRLFQSESVAHYAAPGYLLFNRGDTVFAQVFDADKLALTGEPIRVANGVPLRLPPGANGAPGITRSGNFAVSQTGVLAYRTGASATAPSAGTEETRTLFWFDREGGQPTAASGTTGGFTGIDLSPDGKRVALHRHDGSGGDNWILDLAEQRMQRLTFDASLENASPVWSPDGTRIAFVARRNNREGLYVKPADGSAMEELVFESDVQKVPMSWSADGKLLVFVQNTGANDVWAVQTSGEKKPFPLVQSQFAENFAQVSPDGKWLAYQSNETGRAEIYVKPFPDGPGKWQVSTDGGQYPRWRRDSKELFFLFNGALMAADIRVMGSSFEAGVPRTLFGIPNPSAGAPHFAYQRYAVSADGRRFLLSAAGAAGRGGGGGGGGIAAAVLAAAEASNAGPLASNPVAVVLNWTQMLKEK